MAIETRLFAIASRLKNPLSLSGSIVVMLYLVYRQILSLHVFANIGSQPTFLFLQNLVNRVFWLAVIALLSGVVSYVLAVVLRPKEKSSGVVLIDASLDKGQTNYVESHGTGKKSIRPK